MRYAAIVISILLAASLSACSPQPSQSPAPSASAASESISTACEALGPEVEQAKAEMQQAAEVLNTKTAAAADLLGVAAFRLDFMADEKLENEDVRQVAADMSERLTELSDLLAAAAEQANADTEAIDAAGDEVNAAFATYSEVCVPAGDSSSASCDALEEQAAGVNTQLSTASELLSSDPTNAAAMVADAADRFGGAASAVEDEDVRSLAVTTSDSLTRFSGLIDVLAADPSNPDEDALATGSADLNAAFSELATFCQW